MPRTNSSNNSRNNSYRKSSPISPVQNTQTQVVQHQVQSPGIGTSIKDGIASGFGWGIGSSIARNIFGGSSAPSSVPENKPIQQISTNDQQNKCMYEQNEFFKCLKNNGSGMCYDLEENLKKCIEK
jgi:hypothetical protein